MLIVISCSEDGDRSSYRMTKAELLTRLNDKDDWGGGDTVFAPAGGVPDLEYFVGVIIIDGDIVAPHPEKTVTEWAL
jgi:hypothetical protein